MPGLELYAELTPDQVATWAAAMRHSPHWLRYSMKNPRSTDEAVAMVQEARGIRLKISHIGGKYVAAHWLKLMHYLEHYAWDDGFVFPEWRGKQHHGLLMDEWNLFQRWARDQGYPDILCASFVDNTAAHDWIVECCGLYVVGTRTLASPRAPDSVLSTVVVYATDGQDVMTARKRAEQVYTQGIWIDDSAGA